MKNNIAVIGCGYWGKNLVRNFHELGALHTVCDASRQTLDNIASQYSGVAAVQDYNNVLADASVQGVAIASPSALHHELAKKALLVGQLSL